jgi:hypothetical protein
MGKAFLVILLIAIAAFFIYKQSHRPATEEELAVKAVDERFTAASNKFISAAGGGLAVGLDEAETAVVEVQRARIELARLKKTLKEDKAVVLAEDLRAKIDEFCRKNDIR